MRIVRSDSGAGMIFIVAGSVLFLLQAHVAGQGVPVAEDPPGPPIGQAASRSPGPDEISERLRRMEEANSKLLREFDKLSRQNNDLSKENKELSKEKQEALERPEGRLQKGGSPGEEAE